MKSQSSVGKRIIWAVCMVVLCTFLTFFLSMFLGSAFPEMNLIYKTGIPVLVFVALGVISLGVQKFLLPFLNDLSVPQGLKKALPIVITGLGILMQQMYYDEHSGSMAETELFQSYAISGRIYDTAGFGFGSIYQSGLNILRVLFGNTVFSVSFLNRLLLLISAVLFYFAIKNITGKAVASNLFLVLFYFSGQTLNTMVKPEAGLIYLVMIAVFALNVSVVYHYRTRTTNFIAQIVSVFLMGCLFAVLFISESNSIIFALPAILVSFSGRTKQDTRWYYILAVECMILILITCAVVFILKPEIVLNFGFELPVFQATDSKTTMLLVLNLLGFLGIYGMWNQRIFYVVPAFMGIYFIFATPDFASGITGETGAFLCFALYAALGVGLLDNSSEEEEALDEEVLSEEETPDESVKADADSRMAKEIPAAKEEKKEQEEINTIKALNESLNKVQAGFVPKTFKQPKRQEKKSIDFAYEPTTEEMKYDIEVPENDDFDI